MSDTQQLYDLVMNEVKAQLSKPSGTARPYNLPEVTQFVGIGEGDTIGLVIPNVDRDLKKLLRIPDEFSAIGILGGRTGAGPQILSADEAIKATNSEIISVELPRDTKGGAGHGSLIIFGAHDVADVTRAVEISLEDLKRTFGDVYGNDAGHIELQYTARASLACQAAFGAPPNKAFGVIVGAPAAIGVVMADVAVKAATVDIVACATPQHGQSFSNEVTLLISGDSGAVKQAVMAARDIGLTLLEALGGPAPSASTSYIK